MITNYTLKTSLNISSAKRMLEAKPSLMQMLIYGYNQTYFLGST